MFKWQPAVVCTRGEHVETVHYGGLVAVENGKVLFELGESGSESTFFRSSAKIWQAAPMMERARAMFRFSDEEVALAVASHNGEIGHCNLAKEMLRKIGLPVSALLCGAHLPYCNRTLAEDEPLCALHNNCSGKHAGMLAACVANQWPLETYQHHDHPLQEEIRKHLRRAAGLEEGAVLKYGVDGCGVPTYCLTLKEMATMYSNVNRDYSEARRCMVEHSWCVAGENEFDTVLPIITKGRIAAKRGGAALQCISAGSIGIVAKVGDGATTAVKEMMVLRALEWLKLLSKEEQAQLERFSSPQRLQNVAGNTIGERKVIF